MSYDQGRRLEQIIVKWAKTLGWDAGRHASSKGSHDVTIAIPLAEKSIITGCIFFISCKAGKQSFASERTKMKHLSQQFGGIWVLVTGSTKTLTSVWAFEDGELRMNLATHLMVSLLAAQEALVKERKTA